jgi:hypothetical protein
MHLPAARHILTINEEKLRRLVLVVHDPMLDFSLAADY